MGTSILLPAHILIELTSADVSDLLEEINRAGIVLSHVDRIDELTVTATMPSEEMRTLKALLSRRGEKIQILERKGAYWRLRSLLRRPVLITGLLFLLILSLWIPSRVLFIRIEGNCNIPAKQILAQAEQCGIRFGAARSSVRSEKLKNALLEVMPELQWAAVNTTGCVAIITVQERSVAEQQEPSGGVSSIIAARDGIITECIVKRGTPLCKVGQAVQTGEVLVSGYNDCGFVIQALRADAEVYAQTKRSNTVVMPLDFQYRGQIAYIEKKYSLIFGKKKINFYIDSGISDVTCDKMYEEYPLSLPGGFTLPVAIAVESVIHYNTAEEQINQEDVVSELTHASEEYVLSQMISGEILDSSQLVNVSEQLCILTEEFTCREMIGRVKNEENIISHGKDN